MTRRPPSFAAAPARWLVVWLVACLLPVQGMTSGLLAVLGPQHLHRAGHEARVLDDFRRMPVDALARRTQAAGGMTRMHSHDGWQRHHHRHDDASVVKAGGMADTVAGDADDAGFSPALGAFVALLGAAHAWLPPASAEAFVSGPGWPLLTHLPSPLERPPRSA